MKMLLGLTKPDSGKIRIFGEEFPANEKKILPQVGSLIESPGFYPNLTGTENLKIFAELRRIRESKSNSEGSGACRAALPGQEALFPVFSRDETKAFHCFGSDA